MESDRYKKWRRGFPFEPWPFTDIDEMMIKMERSFSARFKDLEKEIPKNLVRERRMADGSTRKEIGPIVHGYSVTIGPDGEPEIREFGNVKRSAGQPWKEIRDNREPLVDMVTSDNHIKVIAEIPGVEKEDIAVNVVERRITISVDTEKRKYYKELELTGIVNPSGAKSAYNNGILEITVPLKSAGGHGVRLKVE